jgi:hypothetical protein
MTANGDSSVLIVSAVHNQLLSLDPGSRYQVAADLKRAFSDHDASTDVALPRRMGFKQHYRAALLPSGWLAIYREVSPDEVKTQKEVDRTKTKGYMVLALIDLSNQEVESAGDKGEGSAQPPSARPPGPQV